MKKTIGWGIMATGTIANKFCEGLKSLKDAEIIAVASDLWTELWLWRKHGIKRAYGSYEELVKDPEVDIVYIATPHNLHYRGQCSVLKQERRCCAKSHLP